MTINRRIGRFLTEGNVELKMCLSVLANSFLSITMVKYLTNKQWLMFVIMSCSVTALSILVANYGIYRSKDWRVAEFYKEIKKECFEKVYGICFSFQLLGILVMFMSYGLYQALNPSFSEDAGMAIIESGLIVSAFIAGIGILFLIFAMLLHNKAISERYHT